MAGPSPIAVPGKEPGEVYIPSLGRSFKQIELREDDVYDTVALAAAAIAAGVEVVVFRDISGKNEQHTSLKMTRRIGAGDEAAIFRVGVHPRGAIGQTIPLYVDIKKVLENGSLRLKFNRRQITEGPLIKYQSGYGIGGFSMESAATAVSVGVPSAAAAPTLFVPQQLVDNDDIDAVIRFPDAGGWHNANTTTNAALATYTAPTLTSEVVLTVFLHGVLKNPLGK